MIYAWVRKLIEKYSFVTKVELKNGYVYVHYELNEHKDWKRISIRANKEQLINFIERIKNEIGFYEDFERRKAEGQYDVEDEDTTLIFANN